ncbi:hypothetical protein [Polaromonas sp. CG9_12]|nr:hypothetical protein [Polaromonas sp. CG9_12]
MIRQITASERVEMLGRSSALPTWSPLETMPPGLDLMAKATVNGYSQAPAQSPDGQPWLVLVVALQGVSSCFLILNIKTQERAQLNELTLRALLSIDFEQSLHNTGASAAPTDLTGMLGLAAQVMQQQSFESACLTLVNGLSAEWKLIHASLGWVDGAQTQVVAISHLDRFERNSQQTHLIESALATAVIQGHEVWWPSTYGNALNDQGLADFAQEMGVDRVLVIPVQDAQGITHAVLLLAFPSGTASEQNLSHLQLSLELIQPRLSDLRMRSLGLVSRLRLQSHALSEHVFGPEHAILKLVTVIAVGLLLYAAFGSWKFRVDASAQLNTESTRLISAQFDGRIDQVYATAGDLVKKDVLLVSLDTRELEQQQSELTAEISKAETEVNKNRAEGRLADTEIAQARLDQSLAKAQRMESYLQNANSRAPFEGVIVEGERKDMLGAPVKKGDKLFKLAKIEGLYVTLMVTERQMRYVKPGATGEVALLSHADHNIPIRVNSVIPVAQVKGQEGNQFMITAELLDAPQAWWRPGMTGLARLDAGDKNIAWILTHRIVDNLRLLLWW